MRNNTSIGIRVTPKNIFYAIIKETPDTVEIVLIDRLVIPNALILPEQLKFIRNTFLDIIVEFDVNLACIRVTEISAQQTNNFRIGIEAVIQELFASSPIEHYFSGQISNISAKLSFTRDLFKSYANGTISYRDLNDWSKYNLESREALLSAFSALKLI